MSDSQPHEALFLPFGDHFEFNDAGDVVRIHLVYNKNINYEGDDWRKVADAIVCSPALKGITLKKYDCDDDSLDLNAITAVFGRERTHPCVLEEFNANVSFLGPESLAVMLPFLKSTPEIKMLSFNYNKLGDEGTRLLSEVLDHTRVGYLNLCGNQINGEGLGRFFSAEHSKHLHKLDLEENGIGSLGLEAICRFLQRDDAEMMALYFNFVNQDQFRTVLESISPRSKLVALLNEVESEEYPDEKYTMAMSKMLRNVVCNTGAFEGLCESNHQLVWVGPYMCHMLNFDPILTKAIRINNQMAHGASIVSRLRSKLRAFYFQGQFDVQPFIDMNVVFMPFILELVTRTEHVFPTTNNNGSGRLSDQTHLGSGLGLKGKCVTLMEGDLGSVYHLVRNCHLAELFTFPPPKSRIETYENRIASLEKENARLAAENKDLQVENEALRTQLSHP